MSLASSAPVDDSSGSPGGIALANDRAAGPAPHKADRAAAARSARAFSSTTRISIEPLAQTRATISGSSGHGTRELQEANRAAFSSICRIKAELAKPLAHIEVGFAGRDHADLRRDARRRTTMRLRPLARRKASTASCLSVWRRILLRPRIGSFGRMLSPPGGNGRSGSTIRDALGTPPRSTPSPRSCP